MVFRTRVQLPTDANTRPQEDLKPMLFRRLVTAAAFAAAALTGGGAYATPGFIALEGSDATAFHQDPSYTPELFHYLSNGSSIPVLVYDTTGTITVQHPGTANVDYTTTLAGLTLTPTNYSAIYIESPGGCCSADNTVLNGYGTEVSAFIAAGGNLSIENYIGGTYDGVVPGGNAPPGAVQGVGTGLGSSCTDGETVNANGVAKGFTQPPVDGCWEHQGYENSYWESLGYISLIDSSPSGYSFPDGTNAGSALLALGGSLGTAVPEPATWTLFGISLLGLGLVRRRVAH